MHKVSKYLIKRENITCIFTIFKTIEKYHKSMKIHQETCDNFWRFFRENLSMQRFKQQRNMVQIAKKQQKSKIIGPNQNQKAWKHRKRWINLAIKRERKEPKINRSGLKLYI